METQINCFAAVQYIDGHLDQDLAQEQEASLNQHISICASCRQRFEGDVKLRELLQALPTPKPSSAFLESLHPGKAKKAPNRRRYAWLTATAIAAAAANAALWIPAPLALPQMTPPWTSHVVPASITARAPVETGAIVPVRLDFSVPRDLPNVTVSLELPEHLELNGFAEQRVVVWQTDLAAGSNVLTLPVKALRGEPGIITARITNGSRSKLFRLAVIPTEHGVDYSEVEEKLV